MLEVWWRGVGSWTGLMVVWWCGSDGVVVVGWWVGGGSGLVVMWCWCGGIVVDYGVTLLKVMLYITFDLNRYKRLDIQK